MAQDGCSSSRNHVTLQAARKYIGGRRGKGHSDFCFEFDGHPPAVRGPGQESFRGASEEKRDMGSRSRHGGGSLRPSWSFGLASGEPAPCFPACGSPWHPQRMVVRGIPGGRCLGAWALAEWCVPVERCRVGSLGGPRVRSPHKEGPSGEERSTWMDAEAAPRSLLSLGFGSRGCGSGLVVCQPLGLAALGQLMTETPEGRGSCPCFPATIRALGTWWYKCWDEQETDDTGGKSAPSSAQCSSVWSQRPQCLAGGIHPQCCLVARDGCRSSRSHIKL